MDADDPVDGGYSELREAVRRGDPLDAVRDIVVRRPDSIRYVHKEEGSILHQITGDTPPDVVEFLVEISPESLKVLLNGVGTPLHRAAAEDGVSLGAVQCLHRAWTGAVRSKNDFGRIPLHYATTPEKVQFLIDVWPESPQQKDDYGELPLHRAACRDGDQAVDDLRCLIRAYPDAMRERDGKGSIPLHLALGRLRRPSPTSQAIVRVLLDHWPEAIGEVNVNGQLPVHIAVEYFYNSLAIVRLLVTRSPGSLLKKDDEGRVPLHRAAFGPFPVSEQWPHMVHFLIDECPESLQQKDDGGSLPFHFLAGSVDVDVLRKCLAIYAEAIHVTNSDGQLPLHIAAAENRLVPVVRFLVEQKPGSVHARDKYGFLPVHEASNSNDLPVLRYLVQHAPESVQVQERQGSIPLVLAVDRDDENLDVVRHLVEHRRPLSRFTIGRWGFLIRIAIERGHVNVVQYLIELLPESVQERNHGELVPLHWAISDCRNSNMAPSLLGRWPKLARQRNDQGLVPLHVAAQMGNAAMVDLLLRQWSAAAEVRDRHGRVPLHYAAQADVGSSRMLIDSWPDAVHVQDQDGFLPIHLSVRDSIRVRRESGLIVQLLLVAWPDSVRVRSVEGQLPLHLALDRSDIQLHEVQRLLEAWPQSVLEPRARDGLMPMQIALSRGAPLSVVYELSR